jgi:hypothetical protein
MNVRFPAAVFALCIVPFGMISRAHAQAGTGIQGDANAQGAPPSTQQDQSNGQNQGPAFYTPGPAYTGMLPGNSVIVTNPQPLITPNQDENVRRGIARLDEDEAMRTPTHRYDFVYGATISSIYQDHIPSTGGDVNNVGVLATPYFSLIRYTRTGSYSVNYSATVMPYQSIGTPTAAFHDVSLSANGMFTRKWQWSVSATAEYGNEGARIAGPLSFELAGGFPLADAGYAVLTPFNENTVAGVASATLSWQPTQRDTISFSTMSGYTNVLPLAGGPSIDTLPSENVGWEVSYNHNLTRQVSVNEYADFMRSVGPLDPFTRTHCNVYGAGAGLNIDPSRSLSISVGGGPQISGPGCGGSQTAASGWFLLMGHPGPHTRMYTEVSQEYTTIYGLSGHWADTALAGATHDFRSLSVSLDAAAIQGQVSTLGGFTTIRGLFAGPEVQYRFLESLAMMVGYRMFRGSSTPYGTGFMNFATVGLQWTPRSIGFPR